MKAIGVAKASVFRGFCAAHDDGAFEPIDRRPIEPTRLQILLLAYRVAAARVHRMLAGLDMAAFFRAIYTGPSDAPDARLRRMVTAREEIRVSFVDAVAHLENLERALFFDDGPSVPVFGIEIDAPPVVLAGFVHAPQCGLDGSSLGGMNDYSADDQLSCSVVETSRGTTLFLGTWVGPSDRAVRFAESIRRIPDGSLSSLVMHFVFEFGEPFCAPSWWATLSVSQQKTLLGRSAHHPRERRCDELFRDAPNVWQAPVKRAWATNAGAKRVPSVPAIAR